MRWSRKRAAVAAAAKAEPSAAAEIEIDPDDDPQVFLAKVEAIQLQCRFALQG